MSYEEKGVWVYLVVTLTIYGGYLAVILTRAEGIPLSEVAYVSPMLWGIGLSVASAVVGRVLVEMARPSDTHKADARDRSIYRFGEYVGGIVLGVAMVVPFGLTLAEIAHFWIANAMYAAFFLSALVSSSVKLVAYRRGL